MAANFTSWEVWKATWLHGGAVPLVRLKEKGGSYWQRKPAKDFCRATGATPPVMNGAI